LLYLAYRSFLGAAQVLLAVPFALAGGIYLLYALGYNMSVAVWIGFIALFGTAVQTAVVMVIYLEEAVAQKRVELDGRLTSEALLEAVKEGALLRLRPKVMTVSTIVASLLPIMWSHSTGAEVKPIHTQKAKDVVITLASESGRWKPGKNDFVLEFASAKDKQPVDAGKVTLNTSMTMSGMSPMIAGATLSPDKTPGRYVGTI